MIDDPMDQLLTVDDVAGHIGVHVSTVRGWITSGQLAAFNFRSKAGYRIRRRDLEAFLHRRRVTGAIARQLLAGVDNDG